LIFFFCDNDQASATPDFTFGTVDLTNPNCTTWYQGIIRDNMMNISASAVTGRPAGAVGWMADFAEGLPVDALLSEGDARDVHNNFPVLWARTCREAIDTTVGDVDFSSEAVFFTRSGAQLQPTYSTLHWLGDQTQIFNDYDGLATAVTGHASGGLSGYALQHSDVGGYLGFHQLGGLLHIVRDQELLLRWMELSAFVDCMFRTHEGNLPAESVQAVSNQETLAGFARFASVFALLGPYRQQLIAEASALGHPVARHPFLHYPHDQNTFSLKTQLMLGPDIMVCPVLVAHAQQVRCYFPADSGEWEPVWGKSNEKVNACCGEKSGVWVEDCAAPLGEPCVYYKSSPEFSQLPAIIAEIRSLI
jgi:alpha-glucosidase